MTKRNFDGRMESMDNKWVNDVSDNENGLNLNYS